MAKERNAGTAIAIGAGALTLGAGLFFLLKRPKGVDPGDILPVTFQFEYLGSGGAFVLVLRFGWYKPPTFPLGFDQEETMGPHELDIDLPGPDTYEVSWEITIPEGARIGNYDAEASILTPDMEIGHDWIIRSFLKNAIVVRKQ